MYEDDFLEAAYEDRFNHESDWEIDDYEEDDEPGCEDEYGDHDFWPKDNCSRCGIHRDETDADEEIYVCDGWPEHLERDGSTTCVRCRTKLETE